MKILIRKVLFLVLLVSCIYGHPHTFIEVKTIVEVTDEIIDNIRVRWIIDEMTSMILIMEFDNNGNGKFEKEENDFIYNNYFISLEKYSFYTHILLNKEKLTINPKNFVASIENNRLIYDFDIVEALNMKNLKIDFLDNELFIGMILKENYINFIGVSNKQSKQLKKKIFGVN